MRVDNNKKKKKSKKSFILKNILIFFLFQCIFTGITFPIYSMYGPFKNVRNWIVTTSMATGKHQYIAKMFFSDKQINDILAEENKKQNDSSVASQASSNKVKITFDNDSVKVYDASSKEGRFDGKAIIIKDPLKVKVGYSSKLGVAGEMVSDMASRYNALAAINGAGFENANAGTGGTPTGIIISDGKVIYPKSKSEYNTEYMSFSIDGQGNMSVGVTSVNQLIKKNAQQALSFEPSLVVGGKPYISNSSLTGQNPRTAIGQRADKSIIFLVIDGRKAPKLGATLKEVQTMMLQLGAVNAMCLDGGGSSVMYYNNEVINNPSSISGERAVPDCIYVER